MTTTTLRNTRVLGAALTPEDLHNITRQARRFVATRAAEGGYLRATDDDAAPVQVTTCDPTQGTHGTTVRSGGFTAPWLLDRTEPITHDAVAILAAEILPRTLRTFSVGTDGAAEDIGAHVFRFTHRDGTPGEIGPVGRHVLAALAVRRAWARSTVRQAIGDRSTTGPAPVGASTSAAEDLALRTAAEAFPAVGAFVAWQESGGRITEREGAAAGFGAVAFALWGRKDTKARAKARALVERDAAEYASLVAQLRADLATHYADMGAYAAEEGSRVTRQG